VQFPTEISCGSQYIQALCNLSNMGDAIVHRESERTMDRTGYCLVFLLVYVK
jgi:hypothetical protein